MKMKRSLKAMHNELTAMVAMIQNGKVKTDKETIKSIIVNWKMICTRYLTMTEDAYTCNIIYAFQGAVNTHLHELPLDEAYKFVQAVLDTLKEVI